MIISSQNTTTLKNQPEQVARAMEGLFWEMLTRELLKETSLFSKGFGGEIFQGLFVEALAGATADALPLGLTRGILEQQFPTVDQLPVQGKITSGFGLRKDPFTGETSFHRGLDIAATEGTAIVSVNSGQVVQAGSAGSLGLAVVIRGDDGSLVTYGHCSRLEVAPGERVILGQKLAEVGHSGRSTGPHVHLQVTWKGESVNPLDYLRGRLKN